MNWREKWIFQVFGRVLVARWARRLTTAGFIAMVVFAVSAVVEQLGYVQDRVLSPLVLCCAAFVSFGMTVCAAFTGAYATRRRVSR
jgi:hypothetical protein